MIKYIDKSAYSGDMNIFTKTNDYAHQQEFRIALTSTHDFDKPFQFDIGCRSDIAQIIETKKFKNRIEIDDEDNQIIRI